MTEGSKKLIVVIAIVVLGFIVAWFLFQLPPPRNINSGTERAKAVELRTEQDISVRDTKQRATNPEELLEASPKLQKKKQIQQAANREMNFYGKVVDQNGEPVVGARVEYSYAYYPDLILPTFSWSVRRDETITDGGGRFEISNLNGVAIDIDAISHPGYVASERRSFEYRARTVDDEPFQPDPANPVIFHAWKKGYSARELKQGEDYWAYRTDGEYYKIPMDGLEDGLQVHFELLGNEGSTDEPRQWRATLKLDGGGLVETTDIFLYEAPESGYQSEWKIVASENDRIERKFYFKAKNGQIYGRISMTLRGYYGDTEENRNKGFIDYEYALNPTGSRNLLPADE